MENIIEKSKTQGLDTLARIGGAVIAKLGLAFSKTDGLVPALILTIGGFIVAIKAPDKFKLKEMGEGAAMFGGMKFLGELTNDQINLVSMNGVGSLAGVNTVFTNPIPESIRGLISTYLPTIDGLSGATSINVIQPIPAHSLPMQAAAVSGLSGAIGNAFMNDHFVSEAY